MSTKNFNKENSIRCIMKKTVNWGYLSLFYLVTGYGFYRTVLMDGSSNFSGVANYSILALFFLIPVIAMGNAVFEQTGDGAKEIINKFMQSAVVFFIGLSIYIPFGFLVSAFGVFRWGLFFNTILNIALIGLTILSVCFFVANAVSNKVLAYIIPYGLALTVVVVELMLDVIQSQTIYRILYALSLSKYTMGLNAGIWDWSAALLFICIFVLFVLLTVITAKRQYAKEAGTKAPKKRIRPVIAIGMSAVVLSVVVMPSMVVYGIDVTPAQFYSLGTTAQQYAEMVDQEVTITVLESKQDFADKQGYSSYFVQAERVLENLANSSDYIKLEYADLDTDSSILDTYAEDNVKAGDILVACREQYQIINSEELFNFTYPYDQNGNVYMQVASSKAEQEICSAIETVISNETDQIVFLLGNSEHESYTDFASFLENKGYDVEFANVYEQEIPDAKLAILFAPSEDYADTSMLQEYLYNDGDYGRNLLYVANSDCTVTLDTLDAFLALWGITVENYTIVETESENAVNSDPLYGLNEYMEASFVSDFEYLENPAVVPSSRNITIEEETTLSYRVLLQSKETSCLTNGNTLIDQYDHYTTAVISSYYQTNAFGNAYTGIAGHVAVVGSEYAFDTQVMESDEYSNSKYFLDVADELLGKNDVKIPIAEKSLTLGAVELSDGMKGALTIFFIGVLPLTAISISIVSHVRKRGKIKLRSTIYS